jgi:hypothetical protein
MTKFAIAILAVVSLVQPALSVAGDKPSSYVPHPHTNHHVYGAPIQTPILGHTKASHHKPTPKKRSSSATNRDAR